MSRMDGKKTHTHTHAPKTIDNISMCVVIPYIEDVKFVNVPVGVTGFLIHLPSAVLAFVFLARRIQPFLSLVDREVKFCVLTI